MTMNTGTSHEQLAMDGAQPVRKTSFAPWPHFEADEIDAVTRVLQSGKVNYWTGEEGRRFGRNLEAREACKYALLLPKERVVRDSRHTPRGFAPGTEVR